MKNNNESKMGAPLKRRLMTAAIWQILVGAIVIGASGIVAWGQDTFIPGTFQDEVFTGPGAVLSRGAVEAGAINSSALSGVSFAASLNNPQSGSITSQFGVTNLVRHVSGVFVPPVSGNYVFWLASEGDSSLYLSSDSTQIHRQLVAQESVGSSAGEWTTSSGGSQLAGKRTDQFIPPGFVAPPNAAGIPLVAGNKYYFEVFHHQKTGGDNVWVTSTLVGDPAPVGVQSLLSPDPANAPSFGYFQHAPTFLAIDGPASRSVYPEQTIQLSGRVYTDATPLPVQYQWLVQQNGIFVPIAGATASVLTINSSSKPKAAFAGTFSPCTNLFVCDKPFVPACPGLSCFEDQICCTNVSTINFTVALQATLPTGATTVSAPATVSVYPSAYSAVVKGGIKHEVFQNNVGGYFTRQMLEAGDGQADFGNLPSPGTVRFVPGAVDLNPPGGAYVARYSGHFVPKSSGWYTFFLAAADDTDLFLSTDSVLGNSRLIGQETVGSNPMEWTTSSGGSDPTLKRSDTWSPDGGVTVPYAQGILLKKGISYYFEAVQHHGSTNAAHFGFTVKKVSAPDPINGQASTVQTNQLWFFTRPPTSILVANDVTSQTANRGDTVTFTGSAMSDCELTPQYQWLENGNVIPGVTGTSLVLNSVKRRMDGNTYQWVATVPGTPLSVTSSVATLTVNSGNSDRSGDH